MRLVTVFVASVVAMMAPTAWAAATAHLTMTVDGSSTYTPTPGETFRVDVYIQANSPMVSWGMQLRDEADAGYTMKAPVYAPVSVVQNYCDAPGPPPYNLQGWASDRSSCKHNWLDGYDIDGVRPGTIAIDLYTGAVSGFAMFLELTAPSVADLNTRVVLDDVYAGDLEFNPFSMTYDPLILLPEPATLSLFALGGLAVLRRRR